MAFDLIAKATVSTSAEHARDLGFLRPHDRITSNNDRVLADAKAFALELADGYAPPVPVALHLPGLSSRFTLVSELGQAALRGGVSEHDQRVGGALARVLTGGEADPLDPVSENDLLALESVANRELFRTEPTRARIAHMLAQRKPLRN